MRKLLTVGLVSAFLLALLLPVGTTAAKNRPPGVSALSYSPKPFYKDMSEMRVRFTTTGWAGQGRTYQVLLFTGLDNQDEACMDEFSSSEIMRGSRFRDRKYSITLGTTFDDRDGVAYACFGKARLVVWTEQIWGTTPRRVMRKLSLEILPPRS